MINFSNDYSYTAAPEILQALTQLPQPPHQPLPSYGRDAVSEQARETIRAAVHQPDAAVYFLAGGTQANALALDTLLPSYAGVIAADTAHIAVHEAGAIEFTGHKVITLPSRNSNDSHDSHDSNNSPDGKISPAELSAWLADFHADSNHDIMAQPAMVYLTFPTELGTLYTAAEFREIADICHKNDLLLYVDGARMAYGLASEHTDIDLALIAELATAFCIGGTKCGAMFGEALVFPHAAQAPAQFQASMRQHGALLAKGWLVAQQFQTLFAEQAQLYLRYGRAGNRWAQEVLEILMKHGERCGIELATPVQANQVFVTVTNNFKERLAHNVAFADWRRAGADKSVIRFVTGWATADADIAGLDNALTAIEQTVR